MDYFDVARDIDFILLFTGTHSPAENLKFLNDKGFDCRQMSIELKRICHDEKYDECTSNNIYRKIIIDKLQCQYNLADKESIKSFLDLANYNINNYTLEHINVLIKKNKKAKNKYTSPIPPPIDFHEKLKILSKLISLLVKKKFLRRVSRIEILYHYNCDDISSYKDPRVLANHRMVWLESEHDLAYLAKKMVEKTFLKEYGKYVQILPHFVKRNGEDFKNFLSQTFYSKHDGLNDYVNQQIDEIFNELDIYKIKVLRNYNKR